MTMATQAPETTKARIRVSHVRGQSVTRATAATAAVARLIVPATPSGTQSMLLGAVQRQGCGSASVAEARTDTGPSASQALIVLVKIRRGKPVVVLARERGAGVLRLLAGQAIGEALLRVVMRSRRTITTNTGRGLRFVIQEEPLSSVEMYEYERRDGPISQDALRLLILRDVTEWR